MGRKLIRWTKRLKNPKQTQRMFNLIGSNWNEKFIQKSFFFLRAIHNIWVSQTIQKIGVITGRACFLFGPNRWYLAPGLYILLFNRVSVWNIIWFSFWWLWNDVGCLHYQAPRAALVRPAPAKNCNSKNLLLRNIYKKIVSYVFLTTKKAQ